MISVTLHIEKRLDIQGSQVEGAVLRLTTAASDHDLPNLLADGDAERADVTMTHGAGGEGGLALRRGTPGPHITCEWSQCKCMEPA